MLYWTDRTTDPDGWFYKIYHDWEEELRFSYYQVQRMMYGDERVQTPKLMFRSCCSSSEKPENPLIFVVNRHPIS